MEHDAGVQGNFHHRVAESIYRGLRRGHRVTSQSILYEHQNFYRPEAPHLEMNRRLEQRVFGEPVRKFAIALVVQILAVRGLANKSRSSKGNVAQDRKSTRLNSSHVEISYA